MANQEDEQKQLDIFKNTPDSFSDMNEMYKAGNFLVLNPGHAGELRKEMPAEVGFFQKVATKEVTITGKTERILLIDLTGLERFLEDLKKELTETSAEVTRVKLINDAFSTVLASLERELGTFPTAMSMYAESMNKDIGNAYIDKALTTFRTKFLPGKERLLALVIRARKLLWVMEDAKLEKKVQAHKQRVTEKATETVKTMMAAFSDLNKKFEG